MESPFSNIKPETFRKYYRPLEPLLEKPKNRVYTATILSFFTISLFVWFAIRPTIKTILSLRREIKDSTVVDAQMETKIEALVEAQANYQAVASQLDYLNQSIPEAPDMVSAISQIRNLANSVDATISATSLSNSYLNNKSSTDPNAEQSVVATPLDITVEGSYESVKQFIEGLYGMRRIVSISDMSLTPVLKSEKASTLLDPSVTMNVRINTYSLTK